MPRPLKILSSGFPESAAMQGPAGVRSRYQSVLFVNPPSLVGQNFSDGCYPPRGIWSVMLHLRRRFPELELDLADGNLQGYAAMEAQVLRSPAELVAVSVHTTFAYPHALQLLERLQGTREVVLGGFHVTCLPEEVVRSRHIDLIEGVGEEALERYLTARSKAEVPGLNYWDGGSVRRNPLWRQAPPWEYPLEFSVIDPAPYQARFRTRHPVGTAPVGGYLFFTRHGCVWRDTNPPRKDGVHGGCSFCCLPQEFRLPDPALVWDEISRVIQAWGRPVFFKDYGDCFSGEWSYGKRLLASRPLTIRPEEDSVLEVYCKPNEVTTREHGELLRELGVKRVFVGFESAHPRVLKAMNKGSGPQAHRRCAEILFSAGIELNASFILGCETEDEESVAATVRFAEWLKKIGGSLLVCTGASPLAVMPGSPTYGKLLEVEPRYRGLDNPPFDELRRAWIHHFCAPDLQRDPERSLKFFQERAEYIGSLAPVPNYIGWAPEVIADDGKRRSGL